MTDTRHPACDLPEQERIDYLLAVASIVWPARVADPAELSKLGELCATLGVTGERARGVLAAASAPDRERGGGLLARFRKDALRVALLTDVIALTFALARVATGEATAIAWLARELDLTTAQIVLIGRYVEGVVQGHSGETLTAKLAGKLATLPGPVPHPLVVADLAARRRRGG